MNSEAAAIQLPKAWVQVDETPVLAANEFLLLPGPVREAGDAQEEFVLMAGHAATPPLLGTPEEVQEQAEEIEFVPVRTLARFSITPSSLKELARLLSETETSTNA